MRINIKDILEQKQNAQINIREVMGEPQPESLPELIHVSEALDLEDPEPEIQPQPEPVIEVVLEREEKLNAEQVIETAHSADTEPELEPSDEQEPMPEKAQTGEPETMPETAPLAEPESEPEPTTELETPAELETMPETAPLAEPESEPEPEATDEPKLTAETELDPEPTAEPELIHQRSHLSRFGAIYGNVLLMGLLIVFTIFYTTMTPRTIHATINGEKTEITTEKYTVIEALEGENLDYCDEDYLSVAPEAYVTDGMKLELIHAKDFTVTADGETKNYKSLEETVGGALRDKGIKIGEIDIVEPNVDETLKDNEAIVVKRVVIKEETVSEATDFETITEDDSSMAEGKTKVTKEGIKGEDQVTYKITYTDGEETKRKEIDRKVIKKPVAEVVAKGTAVTFNGKMYSRKLQVKAYSYTGGGRTAMGTRARVGEIAVDPKVIPLGTTVYIPGIGERRAEDTGGNIKGKTIDIYMSSKSACRKWGRRYITIYLK